MTLAERLRARYYLFNENDPLMIEAARRIEALEAAQPAHDEDVKAPETSRYVIEPHVLYTSRTRGPGTKRTSWKIYDRSRRAQSFGGLERPGPYCVAYFYDEAAAYKVCAWLNGNPRGTAELLESANDKAHAEHERAEALAAHLQKAGEQREELRELYRLANININRLKTELEGIYAAASGRSLGVALPDYISDMQQRVRDSHAAREAAMLGGNYRGYSAQAWHNQWELACANVAKLADQLRDDKAALAASRGVNYANVELIATLKSIHAKAWDALQKL